MHSYVLCMYVYKYIYTHTYHVYIHNLWPDCHPEQNMLDHPIFWPLPKHLTRRTPSRSLDHLTNRRQRTDLLYIDVHPTYVGNNHIIPRYIMICGRYLCYTWVIHHLLTGMRLRVAISKPGIVILGRAANETWLKPPTSSQIKLKHQTYNI